MSTYLREQSSGNLHVAGAMETRVGLIRKVNEDVVSFVIPKNNSICPGSAPLGQFLS